MPVANLTGLTLGLRRSSPQATDWRVTQTGGRDLADLANFTNPRIGDDMRFAEDEIWQAQANARYATGWRVPVWLKFGAKVTEDYHRFRNQLLI